MKLLTRKNLIIAVLILGGIILVRQFTNKSASITYQTQEVVRDTLVSSITSSGTINNTSFTSISSLASGSVSKVLVKDGDTVKAGQTLATLILDEAGRLAYLQALSSYQSASNSLSSAKNSLNTLQSSLFAANQKFINDAVARELSTDDPTFIQQQADWKAAENNYLRQSEVIKQAQSALSQAALSLKKYSNTIIAPTSGTLSGFTLQEGQLFTGGESVKVANIYTGAKPSLTVNLTEIDVLKIKPGLKANITLDSQTDQSFTGKVVSVDKAGTQTSGVSVYPVSIVFDLTADSVLPNMAATANIILDLSPNTLSVPTSAITTSNNQSTVRVLENGQPKEVIVTLGLSNDSSTEILTGLNEGDQVITGTISNSTASTPTTSVFSSFGRTPGAGGASIRVR